MQGEDIYKDLEKYNIFHFTIEKNKKVSPKPPHLVRTGQSCHKFMFSPVFINFAENLNRSVEMYLGLKNSVKENPDGIDYQMIAFYQSAFILLVNSLEVYLSKMFREIAKHILIWSLDFKPLTNFLKTFRLEKEYVKQLGIHGPDAWFLDEILVKRLKFQQKEIIKVAYKTINIDIVEINGKLWQKFFDRGYMDKRHEFIHKNINDDLKDFIPFKPKIQELKQAIIDFAEFVFNIEKERFNKYPDPYEINGVPGFEEPPNNIQHVLYLYELASVNRFNFEKSEYLETIRRNVNNLKMETEYWQKVEEQKKLHKLSKMNQ